MTLRALALAVLIVPAAARAQATARAADLVLTGGRIFTADSLRPWATALAVRGERIVAVGSDAAVARFVGPRTRRVALDGRVVIPGIDDAHTHLGDGLGGVRVATADTTLFGPTLAGPTPAEVYAALRAANATAPAGAWLRVAIGMRVLGDPTARRDSLDAAAPGRSVLLSVPWGHGTIVSSTALRAMGVADDAADPLGGSYERDAAGRLTGMMLEYAAWKPQRALATTAGDSAIVAALRAEAAMRVRWGVTSVQDMAGALPPAQTLRVLVAARLPMRVRVVRWPALDADGRHLDEWRGLEHAGSAMVRVSGTKYVLDGTPMEEGALSRAPYPDRPGRAPGWHGRLNVPVDTLRQILREALASTDQTLLHVASDSSLALVLSTMESLAPAAAWQSHRLRIEHASRLGGPFVERARRLGIVVAQPRMSAALATWRRAGLVVAYGSDGPPNPFVDMMVAVTEPARPTEAISREEAVVMLTRGAAYAERMEQSKGTLAPGMLADFAVLSQDVFTVPPAALPATTSTMTVVGGRVVWENPR